MRAPFVATEARRDLDHKLHMTVHDIKAVQMRSDGLPCRGIDKMEVALN